MERTADDILKFTNRDFRDRSFLHMCLLFHRRLESCMIHSENKTRSVSKRVIHIPLELVDNLLCLVAALWKRSRITMCR